MFISKWAHAYYHYIYDTLKPSRRRTEQVGYLLPKESSSPKVYAALTPDPRSKVRAKVVAAGLVSPDIRSDLL